MTKASSTSCGGQAGLSRRKVYGADDEVRLVLDGQEVGQIAVRDLLP